MATNLIRTRELTPAMTIALLGAIDSLLSAVVADGRPKAGKIRPGVDVCGVTGCKKIHLHF
jgi:MFS superfamily sulfate permease-like transporter